MLVTTVLLLTVTVCSWIAYLAGTTQRPTPRVALGEPLEVTIGGQKVAIVQISHISTEMCGVTRIEGEGIRQGMVKHVARSA